MPSHQNVLRPPGEPNSSARIPTRAAVTMLTSIEAREATALPVRVRPCARPSSAWAAIDHTPPGMYLPSWPTKKIDEAATIRTGDPVAAIIARQESMFANSAARVSTRPSITVRLEPGEVGDDVVPLPRDTHDEQRNGDRGGTPLDNRQDAFPPAATRTQDLLDRRDRTVNWGPE